MNEIINRPEIETLISLALCEDLGSGDVTTDAVFSADVVTGARILAKDTGIFCGGSLARAVYQRIDADIETTILKPDGAPLSPGEPVLAFRGHARGMLSGERTVLNFIQRMSGIATKTHRMQQILTGSSIKILDTRKTAPGLRLLDKYAVKTGGGTNHRMGLFDMVMIKDNHIRAAGGIGRAVDKIRQSYGSRYTIEVEATSVSEVEEALAAGADIIMLDNMDMETMRRSVDLIGGRAKTEISGNVDEDRLTDLRTFNVDFISIGALTHSVKAFDLSMKFD